MLPSKTVFVVGAGASKEVGLPVGGELKEIIATKLDLRFEQFGKMEGRGDSTIFQVLRQAYPNDINACLAACKRIHDGIVLSASIDDFIDAHQHDRGIAECGKLAIARSILEAEKRSKLYFERRNIYDTMNFGAIQNTWYVGFYQLLSHQVTVRNLGSFFENVTVICFNYDRCIEHFLVHAIAANYQISFDEARTLVEKLTIFHPYGSVGPYFGRPHEAALEFGASGFPSFDKVVKSIRTYTEQIEDVQSLAAIRDAVAEAKVVVFLGTAFHSTNMALLRGGKNIDAKKRIFSTHKGISSDDLVIVGYEMAKLCGEAPRPESWKKYRFANECRELFEKFRMALRQ